MPFVIQNHFNFVLAKEGNVSFSYTYTSHYRGVFGKSAPMVRKHKNSAGGLASCAVLFYYPSNNTVPFTYVPRSFCDASSVARIL